MGSYWFAAWAFDKLRTTKHYVQNTHRQAASRAIRDEGGLGLASGSRFDALGLDSLMGLELRNRLESTFGLQLSSTLLWTYGSSRALAGALCERVLGTPES